MKIKKTKIWPINYYRKIKNKKNLIKKSKMITKNQKKKIPINQSLFIYHKIHKLFLPREIILINFLPLDLLKKYFHNLILTPTFREPIQEQFYCLNSNSNSNHHFLWMDQESHLNKYLELFTTALHNLNFCHHQDMFNLLHFYPYNHKLLNQNMIHRNLYFSHHCLRDFCRKVLEINNSWLLRYKRANL